MWFNDQLWFAFIFVSLSYWQQPSSRNASMPCGCDLLSFLYLCRTGNNLPEWKQYNEQVVICFHFCIFVVLATTGDFEMPLVQGLWFAFIFVSLSYWQQHRKEQKGVTESCDLLSFLYLCRTGNNGNWIICIDFIVVICFHFCIFVVLATTLPIWRWSRCWLWFAFIFVSLSYWQQLTATRFLHTMCCDLLSFLYLCRTGNNAVIIHRITTFVVICFHFCIFVVLATTILRNTSPMAKLWFAFIFVSLSYWQQLHQVDIIIRPGCDLLSFLYLCRTGNNWIYVISWDSVC